MDGAVFVVSQDGGPFEFSVAGLPNFKEVDPLILRDHLRLAKAIFHVEVVEIFHGTHEAAYIRFALTMQGEMVSETDINGTGFKTDAAQAHRFVRPDIHL